MPRWRGSTASNSERSTGDLIRPLGPNVVLPHTLVAMGTPLADARDVTLHAADAPDERSPITVERDPTRTATCLRLRGEVLRTWPVMSSPSSLAVISRPPVTCTGPSAATSPNWPALRGRAACGPSSESSADRAAVACPCPPLSTRRQPLGNWRCAVVWLFDNTPTYDRSIVPAAPVSVT